MPAENTSRTARHVTMLVHITDLKQDQHSIQILKKKLFVSVLSLFYRLMTSWLVVFSHDLVVQVVLAERTCAQPTGHILLPYCLFDKWVPGRGTVSFVSWDDRSSFATHSQAMELKINVTYFSFVS